jgi:uncharacterized repeat protein (TIGR01451 family)
MKNLLSVATTVAVLGLAAAMLAWPAGPGAPVVKAQDETPTATATATPQGCILEIDKDADTGEAAPGEQVEFDIDVQNDGDEDCVDVVVSDEIPTDTDCVKVNEPSGVDVDEDECDEFGTVEWYDFDLEPGEDVTLTITLEVESDADEGDDIENEACVEAEGESGVCASDEFEVEEAEPTATPTATRTPVYLPTPTTYVAAWPTAAPAVVPAAETGVSPVVAPSTGTGSLSEGGSMAETLALALGLAGGAVLLASGVAVMRAKRAR